MHIEKKSLVSKKTAAAQKERPSTHAAWTSASLQQSAY